MKLTCTEAVFCISFSRFTVRSPRNLITAGCPCWISPRTTANSWPQGDRCRRFPSETASLARSLALALQVTDNAVVCVRRVSSSRGWKKILDRDQTEAGPEGPSAHHVGFHRHGFSVKIRPQPGFFSQFTRNRIAQRRRQGNRQTPGSGPCGRSGSSGGKCPARLRGGFANFAVPPAQLTPQPVAEQPRFFGEGFEVCTGGKVLQLSLPGETLVSISPAFSDRNIVHNQCIVLSSI